MSKTRWIGNLKTECIWETENYFIAAAMETNLVYWFDKVDFTIKRKIRIGNISDTRLFGSLQIIDDALWIIPFNSRSIYVYNLSDGITECLELIDDDCDSKFLNSFVINGQLILIPLKYKHIVIIDVLSRSIKYIKDVKNSLLRYSNKKENLLFRSAICLDEHIYAPYISGNALLDFDVHNGSINVYKIGNKEDCFSSICYDGLYFWLAPRYGNNIIRWEPVKSVVRRYVCDYLPENEKLYVNMCYTDNRVYVFAGNIGDSCYIDIRNDTFYEFDKYQDLYGCVLVKGVKKLRAYALSLCAIFDIDKPDKVFYGLIDKSINMPIIDEDENHSLIWMLDYIDT